MIRSLKCPFLLLFTLSLLIFSSAGAQQQYNSHWKKIAALESKGLYKTAAGEAERIYLMAKAAHNSPQLIKALIYELKYRDQLEEGALVKNIKELDTEISIAGFPAKEILLSMQAEMYWNYLQQNRYRLYGRTTIQSYTPEDMQTWSADQLNKRVSELYLQSLEPAEPLKKIKINSYDTILLKGKHTAGLWPTLYDLLAHRALSYFMNDEITITQPAYRFEIDNPGAFAPAALFVRTAFITEDTGSLSYRAVRIMQGLIKFHLRDGRPDALVDADLQRLQYMEQKSVLPDKDSLYREALIQVAEQYAASPAAAQAGFLLAQREYREGNQYNPPADTAGQWAIRSAKERCESVIRRFPQSEGGVNCRSLLQDILSRNINMQAENVNAPGRPFRVLVTYRNVTGLYFRLAKIPDSIRERRVSGETVGNYWRDYLLKQHPLRSWSQSFPDPGDYREHRAEMKVDPLPPGSYVLIASRDSSFSMDNNPLAAQFFYVSAISYVGDGRQHYFVLNRETGQPLDSVKVQVWENQYDYAKRSYRLQQAETFTTNAEGYFKIKARKDYRSIRLEFTWRKDHLFAEDNQSIYGIQQSLTNTPELKTRAFLFTDRGIYRPGQTLYFKGIVLQTDPETHKSTVQPDFKTVVYLYGVNGQAVDSLQLTTNRFGSYAGSFRLPSGLLRGQLHLQDRYAQAESYFSVEEYKRPKFYVELKKPSDTYRLGDTVSITGDAKAYSGTNIDGATVKYRVVRRARFPYPWRSLRLGPIMPAAPEMEITRGQTTTDAGGKFIVHFAAIPDRSIREDLQPIFDYSVSADITDINGETRSGQAQIAVGYRALELSLDLPGKVEADSLGHLPLNTTNLSGEFEPAAVELTISKLLPPDRFIRERYWQQPDQFILSRDEYIGYFPHDAYKDEANPATWQKADQVLQQSFVTVAGQPAVIHHRPLSPGWYRVEAVSKDKYGREVRDEKNIQVYDKRMPSLPFKAMLWEAPLKTNAEPGEQAGYLIGSSGKDLYLIRQMVRMNKENEFSTIRLSDTVKRIYVPVNESDRGGIACNYIFVKDNRVYRANIGIDVPWDNKQLEITYETFRDKMLPGSKEQWKLKITGNKGDKVAAEFLAGMYDASLDAFRPFSWPVPDLYPTLSNTGDWNGRGNFGAVGAQQYFEPQVRPGAAVYDKVYDQLNWFGYKIAVQRLNELVVVGYSDRQKKAITGSAMYAVATLPNPAPPLSAAPLPAPVQLRQNLQETAFFFPQLQTDDEGNVVLNFTMPEALTRWKFMAFAHTKDMAYAFTQKEVITQKQLMVIPNPPRFVREGDKMIFTAKISNVTGRPLSGNAQLQLLDAATMQPVDGLFKNDDPGQSFTVAGGQSAALNWALDIPYHYHSALVWRITARAGDYSDGEENALPVLTNSMLVTETLPLPVRGNAPRTFRFEKLLQSGNSSTLHNYGLTVEFTGNPAWYAVQALPYLTEASNECAEQIFNRYYADALASHIVQTSPEIARVLDQWKNSDTTALMSNLEKNQELKSALLEATPWVMEAKNETEQRHRIAILFDQQRIRTELEKTAQQLQQMQTLNGGFSWFTGMPDDRYITQYILTGIGHLQHLQAFPAANNEQVNTMINKAIAYIDTRLKEDYDNLVRKKQKREEDHLGNIQIQYLYMRSFFAGIPVDSRAKTAYNYYLGQAKKYWLNENKYLQGMIALSLFRQGDKSAARAIVRSLKETAIHNEEMGMYWKDMRGGYYWYQAPVETQSLLVEAFDEITADTSAVEEMKTWLLKQKQTRNWKTTRATADAVYALLLQGGDWLRNSPAVKIKMGDEQIDSRKENAQVGTGYFQRHFNGGAIKPGMGNITVTLTPAPAGSDNSLPANENAPSWGAVYWQYFEQLDNITAAATPLRLEKQLFVEKNTDRGPVLAPVTPQTVLKVGDKVKVRMELRCDRDLEYVHLKDMRASCFEPVEVLSGYRWQSGAGYYESTGDVSTDFFFGWLPRGTYVFEYPVFVTGKGDFSNGISTVQCLYAPEFISHSGGIRVIVK